MASAVFDITSPRTRSPAVATGSGDYRSRRAEGSRAGGAGRVGRPGSAHRPNRVPFSLPLLGGLTMRLRNVIAIGMLGFGLALSPTLVSSARAADEPAKDA